MPAPATPYRIEPLAKRHDRAGFACGNEALDRYLTRQARQDADKRVAAPFVVTKPPTARVLGYYTLCASLVEARELPDALASKLPRYPQLPVTMIGRLAVDQNAKGKGAGQFLLMDALHRSARAAADIASMAALVDAKDEAAEAFYRQFDFLPLQQQPPRLFLPMQIVAKLFRQKV